jgi:hypothetical protein
MTRRPRLSDLEAWSARDEARLAPSEALLEVGNILRREGREAASRALAMIEEGRSCGACLHPGRAEIDRALDKPRALHGIARQFGVGLGVLRKHRTAHRRRP